MLTALTTLSGEPPGLLSSGRDLFISDMVLALRAENVKRQIPSNLAKLVGKFLSYMRLLFQESEQLRLYFFYGLE